MWTITKLVGQGTGLGSTSAGGSWSAATTGISRCGPSPAHPLPGPPPPRTAVRTATWMLIAVQHPPSTATWMLIVVQQRLADVDPSLLWQESARKPRRRDRVVDWTAAADGTGYRRHRGDLPVLALRTSLAPVSCSCSSVLRSRRWSSCTPSTGVAERCETYLDQMRHTLSVVGYLHEDDVPASLVDSLALAFTTERAGKSTPEPRLGSE